jgi:hypothetical protein
MNYYEFSLVLSGVTYSTPDLDDMLFEAGCDDGLVCAYNETVYVTFTRESLSYKAAVLSAIKDVESVPLVTVMSVDAGDHVGLSDIAELSNASRQSIQLFKDGKRGKGNFPNPIERLQCKQPLWRWSQVAQWLAEQGKIDQEICDNALVTEAFNQALEARQSKPLVNELLQELQYSAA